MIGEPVKDEKKIEALRKNPTTFFLWNNFVVYTKRIPQTPKERAKMRIEYLSREPRQLKGCPYVTDGVLGVPSMEGDVLIKQMLNIVSKELIVGTCLVGFNINSYFCDI